ncbi:MAG: ferritin-like domain-containing protein [Myxococcales bacterium]|nr:ferritin-like domain-containing protein [Myxococcales bacterium]
MRTSILVALGLTVAGACTPGKGGDGSGGSESGSEATGEATSASGSGSSGSSGSTSGSGSSGGSGSASESMSGSGSASSSGTDTTGAGFSCEGSTPIDQNFVDPAAASGFERCPDGTIHRVEARACEAPATPDSCVDNSGGGACSSAADCTEQPFGSCQQDQAFGGVIASTTCSCVYGCATDSDCADGQICRCAGDGLGLYTECIDGGCVDDSECGDYLCALSPDTCEPGGFVTQCHGPGDLCFGDDDCPDFQPCYWSTYPEPAKWACNDAVCGRPFLVDEVARVAPVIERAGWSAGGPRPTQGRLSPALRSRLGDHWAAIAAMEHASVASFARAILELMAVGAPAELVADAQVALADEIDHAQRAFALASAFAGRELGPGPRARAHAHGGTIDRRRLAEAVAREACVGETVAAAEARIASEACRDPAMARSLAKIAADEERHAQLGWRTLAWLLEGLDPASRAGVLGVMEEAIESALEGLVTAPPVAADSPEEAVARAFGLLPAGERAALVRCALEEIVRPCAGALAQRVAA